jgi:flagellar biosynthesis chaperone FliJ
MDRELSRAQRLIELRERERTAEVVELQRVQADEQVAAAAEEAARAELLRAETERKQLAMMTSAVLDYITLEDWLETLAVRHNLARHRLAQTRIAVRRVLVRVKAAQTRLKQAELLRDRLERARQERLQRVERRADDEIAQRVAANWRKDS